MKLEEAIKRLDTLLIEEYFYPTGKYQKALKLGIEALKWRLSMEQPHPPISLQLLPGQTR